MAQQATQRVQPKNPPQAAPAPAAIEPQASAPAAPEKERNRKPNYMSMAHSTPTRTITRGEGDKQTSRTVLTAVPTDYFSFACTQPTKKDFDNEDLYLEFKISVEEHEAAEAMARAQERKNVLQAVQSEGSVETRQIKRGVLALEQKLEKARKKLEEARALQATGAKS